MNQIILIGVLMRIAGCATTAPVRTADGAWFVSARVPFSGQSGALNQAPRVPFSTAVGRPFEHVSICSLTSFSALVSFFVDMSRTMPEQLKYWRAISGQPPV